MRPTSSLYGFQFFALNAAAYYVLVLDHITLMIFSMHFLWGENKIIEIASSWLSRLMHSRIAIRWEG